MQSVVKMQAITDALSVVDLYVISVSMTTQKNTVTSSRTTGTK